MRRKQYGRKLWTAADIAEVTRLRQAGATTNEIAQMLGRTPQAILNAVSTGRPCNDTKARDFRWSLTDEAINKELDAFLDATAAKLRLPRTLVLRRLDRVIFGRAREGKRRKEVA